MCRLRSAPAHVKETWNKVKAGGALATAKDKFVHGILAVSRGDYTGMEVITKEILEHSVSSVEEAGCLSWKQMMDREGEDKTLIMLKLGTVRCTPDPRVPDGCGVEYPRNQLFHYVDVKQLTQTCQRGSVEMGSTMQLDADDAKDVHAMLAASSTARLAPALTASPSLPAAPVAALSRDGDKRAEKALANLRKAHSEWDRKRREFLSVLSRGRQIKETKDSLFMIQLQEQVDAGDDVDSDILSHEIQVAASASIGDDMLTECAAKCTTLAETAKKANNMSLALKTCMKLAS